MNQPIKLLTEVEYFRDQRPWVEHRTASPTWHDVEAAVRRMDNYCFPFVQLYPTEDDGAEDTLYIIGGGGRYAMSDMMGVWQYVDETRGDAPVHLWESDQGYECRECNISTDIAKVLRIAKHFYKTGSYAQLDAIE